MTKNLMFAIERILQQLKNGKIDLQEANILICEIIETDGKPEPKLIKKDLEKENQKIKIQEEADENTVVFVSDESEYQTNQKNNQKPKNTNSTQDKINLSISSMFDVYLQPNPVSSQNSFGSPFGNYFGDINSGVTFMATDKKSEYWMPPATDWTKVSELNDCVILYRTHSQSRAIEEVFIKNKLPYRLVSGTRFLDRKEIKDIMAMLKFMANGSDKIALSRFLPLVLDGVGAKTLERILAYLEDYEYPLAPKHQMLLVDILTKIQNCWGCKSLIDLCKELIVVSGYDRYLKKEYPAKEEYNNRKENIGEIYSLMLPFDNDAELSLPDKLTHFLAHISLMSMVDNSATDPNQPKINLMSLHQSKGLEYETVFLVGCEDGLLPHSNSFNEPDGMEEEVRLAYVGVTRAKKNLFLTSADRRITFGQIKNNPPSRIFRPFLDKYAKRIKQ